MPLRTNSIRLHLALALGLAVLCLPLAFGPPGWIFAPLVLMVLALARALALHTARRARLLEMLGPVGRAAAGETHVHVSGGSDDEAGQVADAVNALLDTVRQQALEAHIERDLDLALVRETPNGLLVTDAQGLVRRANPALSRLLPVRGNPVGRRPIDSIPVADFQEVIDEARLTRGVCERTLTQGRFDLLIRAMPTADGAGCLGVVLDITSVRASERVRREFVANVSHEIRTPITAIVGYVEALEAERGRIPEDVLFMLDAVKRNSDRLRLLIEDVLHLSTLESRQSDLELRRESVGGVIHAVIERFEGVAKQKGIELVATDSAPEARINADGLEHALSNLVDNALKYTAAGSVRVDVVSRPGGVCVSVKDTGMGIDPVHHARIFERFYRIDGGRARSAGGTGLGLALVKHLCSAMGAQVHLESELGVGSTFTLELPA